MKVRLLPAAFLFLGSYFPLSVILLLQDIAEASWKKSICWSLQGCELPTLMNSGRSLSLFLLCSASLILFIWVLRNLPSDHEVTGLAEGYLGSVRNASELAHAALKTGSDCSFTASKLRFLACFRLAWPSLEYISYRA